jgi:hypothetical protein
VTRFRWPAGSRPRVEDPGSRRKDPRGDDRRQGHFHLPRALEGRRGKALLVVLFAGALLLVSRHPEILRPTRELLLGRGDAAPGMRVRDVPAEDAVLLRQRQGLRSLLAAAARGSTLPAEATAFALVDQQLVRDLMAPHFPRTYEIQGTYRVTISGAHVTFEDGVALVRLDGRASLLEDERVFADVSLYGDLEVLREQPSAAVLKTRINLLALDARRVEVVVDASAAESLVERLGEERVAAFAEVAGDLEIPVRHRYDVELPEVDEGPVRLAATTLPVQLDVLGARAISGRLWIAMTATFDEQAAAPPAHVEPLPVPETPGGDPSAARTAALRAEVTALRQDLEGRARDPRLIVAEQAKGHLVIAVAPELFEAAVQRLAARYFDRVGIVLEDVEVRKSGERRKKALFAEFAAGSWELYVKFSSIRGVLRAGDPRVLLPGGERVELTMPVHIEQGQGRALVRFSWDSRGLVELVCKDFTLEDTAAGRVEHRIYPVSGAFTIAVGKDSLVATPRFSDRFRIHPSVDEATWSKVARALEEQDRLGRCGIGIDPEMEMLNLRTLIAKGFNVRLPRKIFRPVVLPTRLTPTVEVQGRTVDLTLAQSSVRVAPDGVWYGVQIAAAARK